MNRERHAKLSLLVVLGFFFGGIVLTAFIRDPVIMFIIGMSVGIGLGIWAMKTQPNNRGVDSAKQVGLKTKDEGWGK